MPPIAGQGEHQWTKFELQTMLALMARGVHLEEKSNKKDHPDFPTELNYALHRDNYAYDIPRKQITRMLDRMLQEKKGVVGKGGLMERQRTGRITRFLRMAWESNRKSDYDGSVSEWSQGRKKKEDDKLRAEQGLPPSESTTDPAAARVAPSTAPGRVQKRPGRSSAAVTSRFKSRAVALSSDEGDSDGEFNIPARIRKEKLAKTTKMIPASRGYDPYRSASSPARGRDSYTPRRRGNTPESEQTAIAFNEATTPGLTSDEASPEKNVLSEMRRSPPPVMAPYTLTDEMVGKTIDSEVEMRDGEMEELFGATEVDF